MKLAEVGQSDAILSKILRCRFGHYYHPCLSVGELDLACLLSNVLGPHDFSSDQFPECLSLICHTGSFGNAKQFDNFPTLPCRKVSDAFLNSQREPFSLAVHGC